MLVVQVLAAALGLAVLARSASEFVVGASALSHRLGVPPLVVGIVVIGFGTSAPELAVSGLAAFGGNADVGIGNVVGSNIANLTLVLGIAGVVCPLAISSSALRREAPVTVAAMALFALLVQGGLTRLEGFILVGALVTATIALVVSVRRGASSALVEDVADYIEPVRSAGLATSLVRTGLGLIGTLAGAQILVWAALALARAAGLSGGFVGLTLVAVGTSLPEIVTASQASRRGDSELIIGNILGSNTINSLAVGGMVGLAAPSAVVDPSILGPGIVVMMASSVTALVLMRRRFRLSRRESLALIVGYSVAVPLLA